MMNSEVVIQVARDKKTGLPCVRLNDKDDFVSLLPITKLQVEQWIWEGGLSKGSDPYAVSMLLDRMELRAVPKIYPDSVGKLSRVPISKCKQENLQSVLATNLTLWAPSDKLMERTEFPTPDSEWGRVLRWLGGRVPVSGEWKRTLRSYAQFGTKELINKILKLKFQWHPTIEYLLRKLAQTVSETQHGLPFAGSGVYEQISEPQKFEKLSVPAQQIVYRPQVAGISDIWPTLEDEDRSLWRPMLQSHLPVVTIRPWYSEKQVRDLWLGGHANSIKMSRRQAEWGDYKAETQKAFLAAEQDNSLTRFLRTRNPMMNRCPGCYEKVSDGLFQGKAVLWCNQRRTEDGPLIREHSREKPPPVEGLASYEPISREYLTIARKNSLKIRSICLSGNTKSGKGCWLLSLTGMMLYPDGKSYFVDAFPPKWKFSRTMCSTIDLDEKQQNINLLGQIEDMWIDGDVPKRTPDGLRALRCPVLFKLTPPARFFASEQESIFIFNDIAGEIVSKPTVLAKNEFFPHVSSSTDVVFLVPAQQIHSSHTHLRQFAIGLGVNEFEGEALDISKINLILAISQIDLLKGRSEKDEKLLDIFLRPPYILPRTQQEEDMEAYLASMKQVHYDLRAWLNREAPLLVQAAEQFASVRYCGFSAFGFQIIQEGKKPEVEYCLPFEPQPVRVADPLFWLFREYGLLKF